MAFFIKSVTDEYLKKLDESKVKAAFEVLKIQFSESRQRRILTTNEIGFQAEFVEKLFDKVLGYIRFDEDNWNIKREHNSETSNERADAAIMIDSDESKTLAIIELKSTKTHSLQSIEEQVFNYFQQHQPICRYAITSNFQMLRLYVDDNQGFEEFDIFDMVNNERFDRFKLMYLYLNANFVLQNLPAKIREATIIKEKAITDRLYSDYKNFRVILHTDLQDQNPKINKFLLFKKTQKLIDRFIFIFFAEDKGLLPALTVQTCISNWEKSKQGSLLDAFKLLFVELNNGNDTKGIFAYSGGLFEPDTMLDSLKLDKGYTLFNHLPILQGYDFKSTVDVTILGHIFEHSLNDMDEMKALSEGKSLEKSKTKRKKEGVFYTPQYITRYIVDNTIGALCRKKEHELGIVEGKLASKKQLNAYRDWLFSLTVIDPACGSGAFLNAALTFFISEHQRIDERMAGVNNELIEYKDYSDKILKNNIFGVDLNEEAIEIAKLSLWLRTAKQGQKLTELSENIKVGNSLISDPSVSDAAFNWHKKFEHIFDKGGFDIVIGNPPYVRAELLSEIRPYLQQNYKKVYHSASDLFAYFYEKSIDILKPNGLLGFISNAFDKTTAAKELRHFIKEDTTLIRYIDFKEVQIFEGATTYPVIIIAQNRLPSENQNFSFIQIPKSSQPTGTKLTIDIDYHAATQVAQITLDDANWSFKSDNAQNVVAKITQHPSVLEQFGKSYRGLLTGLNEAFIIQNPLPKNKHIKQIHEGKDLKKWHTPQAEQQLILFESKWTKATYGANVTESEALRHLTVDFSDLMKQLIPFEAQAKKRFDKGDFWWELRNCAYYSLFDNPKIVFPNLQNGNKFSFDDKGTYINAPAVFLPSNDKALLAILNSKLVWYFLNSICVVRNGGYIEVKPQYFEQIPIAKYNAKQKVALSQLADKMIDATEKAQKTTYGFLSFAYTRFTSLTTKRSLEVWYESDWKTFEGELKKQKCVLLPNELKEWKSHFEQERRKVQTIQETIRETDAAIDALVYLLYGLTKDEIRIVEGG